MYYNKYRSKKTIDSMNGDNIWAISFRQVDILSDPERKSTEHVDQHSQNEDFAILPVQRVQSGDHGPVQQKQDVKPSEEHVQRVSVPTKEYQHRLEAVLSSCMDRKWLVCLSAFVVMVVDVGFMHAFGTLFVDIMEEFHATRASAAVIQSVLVGVALGTGILCGTLVTRFGPRKIGFVGGTLFSAGLILSYFAREILMLIFTVGVISGLGICFQYISNTTAIGLNFNGPSKVLALSLASTGTGVGGLSYPFFLRYLREKYGLQETFLIVGGIALNTIPCAMLWGAPAEKDCELGKTRNTAETQKNSSMYEPHQILKLVASLFRSGPYMLFVLGNMCASAPLTMFNILITDIYSQKGFGKANSTIGISLMHISSFFGRLASGTLKQIPKFSVLHTPIFCCVISIISMTSVNFTASLVATLVVTAGLGFSLGVLTATRTVTTVYLVGPELFSTGVGFVLTMNGVANLAIGPLSGLVKDVTQSYEIVLYASTVMMACGCVSFCLAFWFRRRRRQQEQHSSK